MNKRDETKELERLLKGTDKRVKKLESIIDDNVGIKDEPYVPNVKTKEWSGLMIPEQIFNICEHFKNVLSEKGLYSTALDFQIYNASVQYNLYNQMVLMVCDINCPLTIKPKPKDVTAFGEGLRHSLRELGITRGTNDRQNIKNLQDHNDPIASMLEKINTDTSDDIVISKKKR